MLPVADFWPSDGSTQKAAGRQTRPGLVVWRQRSVGTVHAETDEVIVERQLSKSATWRSRPITPHKSGKQTLANL
jgi:hypothetical protein